MKIKQVNDIDEKLAVSRRLLESLTEWFEVEESRENYIAESAEQPFFAAYEGDLPVGFLTLKETGAAREYASRQGYSFMQVKTVKMGVYEDYDRTNRFYLSVGFRELEVLPLWDEANPCQVYVMYIGA